MYWFYSLVQADTLGLIGSKNHSLLPSRNLALPWPSSHIQPSRFLFSTAEVNKTKRLPNPTIIPFATPFTVPPSPTFLLLHRVSSRQFRPRLFRFCLRRLPPIAAMPWFNFFRRRRSTPAQPAPAPPTETTPLVSAPQPTPNRDDDIAWLETWRFVSPYLNPETIHLKCLALVALLCVIIQKFTSLLPPYAYKLAVDALANNLLGGPPVVPYNALILYIVAKMLANFFHVIEDYCYAKVAAGCTRRFSVAIFGHLQKLSLAFHLHRKTGEVTRIMDRGASSIDIIANTVIFTLLPTYVCISCLAFFPLPCICQIPDKLFSIDPFHHLSRKTQFVGSYCCYWNFPQAWDPSYCFSHFGHSGLLLRLYVSRYCVQVRYSNLYSHSQSFKLRCL